MKAAKLIQILLLNLSFHLSNIGALATFHSLTRFDNNTFPVTAWGSGISSAMDSGFLYGVRYQF
ncbi:MAG: hypothetical protein M0R38_09065 [Bacteroidia bacterium]|nr:hypothetical protein [Bacteroidia bacterium]